VLPRSPYEIEYSLDILFSPFSCPIVIFTVTEKLVCFPMFVRYLSVVWRTNIYQNL